VLIRKKLTADEFSTPFLRYNPDCDCVQFTPDGGETWIDQPANDPRTSDTYRLPPGDDRCRAAEGMTAVIRAAVDARLATDGDIQLAGEILGIVAFIPGFNVLWALIIALAAFAVTIAKDILEAAFSEPTYDQIRCIFFCNIGDDGQMSQAQFDDAYAALIDLDAIPRTWCQNVMTTLGPVGMSDAGVALEAAADCDECPCGWCYTFDFVASESGWSLYPSAGGTYSSGWQCTVVYVGGNPSRPRNQVYIQIDFTSTTIRSIKTEYAVSYGDTVTDFARFGIWANDFGDELQITSEPVTSPQYWFGTQIADNLIVTLGAGASDSGGTSLGDGTITRITLRGDGTNPFGDDNC